MYRSCFSYQLYCLLICTHLLLCINRSMGEEVSAETCTFRAQSVDPDNVIWSYDFSNPDPSADGILITSPGFPLGIFFSNQNVPSDPINLLSDGKTGAITVSKGEGVCLFFPAQPVNEGGAIVRVSIRANGPDANVCLAAMDTNQQDGLGGVDGSLAGRFPANTEAYQDCWRRLAVYIDSNKNGIVPILQVVSAGNESTTVYIDNFEVIAPGQDTINEISDIGQSTLEPSSISLSIPLSDVPWEFRRRAMQLLVDMNSSEMALGWDESVQLHDQVVSFLPTRN